jgi:predicted nuclease of predicted toxin-antitoxin system
MARVLIDEGLPCSLSNLLRQKGHASQYLIDLGLRGLADSKVFAAAQDQTATLVSRDTDFGNILQYPLGTHGGIVVIRFPTDMRTHFLVAEIVRMLSAIDDADFQGALIIIEPGRIRIRRAN